MARIARSILLLSLCNFLSLVASSPAAGGNSACAQWCAANFPNPGNVCTSPAAKGQGPCYVCGPQKTSPTEQLCSGACSETSTDNKNCGTCGSVCPTGSSCSSGACKCTNSGLGLCNGACPNLQTDNKNCGSCGHTCSSGASCSNGSCGPSQPPTNAVQNPFFLSGSTDPGFDTAPPYWSFSGAVFESDCSGSFPFGIDCPGLTPGVTSWVYFLLSQEDGFDAHQGTVSQTLTGLVPGWTYRFFIQAGFLDSVNTCTVTYALDGVVFFQFVPVNTADAATNTIPMPLTGPYTVVPTAASQVLSFSMSCPNAGDNGGWGLFTNATFWGPYSS